jgi:hypothetical protein
LAARRHRPAIAGAAFLAMVFLFGPRVSLLAQRDYMEPVEVSPARLAEAYKNDFHQADAMYTGKLLIVSGRIKTIRPPERTYNYRQDKIYAYITMDAGRNRPLAIYFWEWEAEEMNRLRTGASISVMGFCQGVPPQLSLIDACVYPRGCGGPAPNFEGPYFKLPPSPPGRPRPAG